MSKIVNCHDGSYARLVAMNIQERATVFGCGTDQLVGIVSRTSEPSRRGVLVVVGGPQYRVGSHRQFVLLSRALSAQGIATMRFDYRGMGDSEGIAQTFEDIDPDIQAALDHFCVEIPEMREVVIWGLCDAASAGLMAAHRDNRIKGLVLLNPWVRTAAGLARTQLKHYYWSRLMDRNFWRKLASGEFSVTASLRSLTAAIGLALGKGRYRDIPNSLTNTSEQNKLSNSASLATRMAEGMRRFNGKVLLILSGEDITAREFEEVTQTSNEWRRLLGDSRVVTRKLTGANHTFSKADWRNQVATWTIEWIRSW